MLVGQFRPRDVYLYSLLLLASFGTTYAYLALRGGAPVPFHRGQVVGNLLPDDTTAGRKPSQHALGSLPGAVAGTDTAQSTPGPAAARDVIAEERNQATGKALAAGRGVMSGATPQERSAAMIQLNAMAGRLATGAEPELLEAFETAATSAPEWQTRISAVSALAGAAQRMTDRSRVLRILERAANDPHRAVANRANVALQNLRTP